MASYLNQARKFPQLLVKPMSSCSNKEQDFEFHVKNEFNFLKCFKRIMQQNNHNRSLQP